MPRSLAIGLSAGLAVALPNSVHAEPPTYMIRELGTLGGSTDAARITNAGHVAGISYVDESVFAPEHPLWTFGGVFTDMSPYEAVDDARILAANNAGEVLFRVTSPDADTYIWRPDGTLDRPLQLVQLPDGAAPLFTVVSAMNDLGQLAGRVVVYDDAGRPDPERIALWEADGSCRVLGTLDSSVETATHVARAMNNGPQVAGWCPVAVPGSGSSGREHAFASEGDRLIDLHPMHLHPTGESFAEDISENGWIAGRVTTPDDPSGLLKWAARWRPDGTFERLPRFSIGASREEAYGVNSDGWCVGFSFGEGAILWDGEGAYRLFDRIIDPTGRWLSLIQAFDINDAGHIVGHGQYEVRSDSIGLRAFELTPCWADADRDRTLDAADFAAFRRRLLDGEPDADLNGDGVLDIGDFIEFARLFRQGCG